MNYQCSRIYKTEKLSKAKDCIFQNTAAVGILPFPLPRKECCCVFKRKRYPWAIVRSNIKLGGGGGGGGGGVWSEGFLYAEPLI